MQQNAPFLQGAFSVSFGSFLLLHLHHYYTNSAFTYIEIQAYVCLLKILQALIYATLWGYIQIHGFTYFAENIREEIRENILGLNIQLPESFEISRVIEDLTDKL